MLSPGLPELIVILVIILIIFGAGKLSGVGKALGKGIRGFKEGSSGEDEKTDGLDDKKKEAGPDKS